MKKKKKAKDIKPAKDAVAIDDGFFNPITDDVVLFMKYIFPEPLEFSNVRYVQELTSRIFIKSPIGFDRIPSGIDLVDIKDPIIRTCRERSFIELGSESHYKEIYWSDTKEITRLRLPISYMKIRITDIGKKFVIDIVDKEREAIA